MDSQQYKQKVEQVIKKYQVKDVEEFFTDMGELLNLVLRDTRPHLYEIDQCIRDNTEAMKGHGTITITVKVFDYKITEAIFNRMTKVKFD